MTTIGRQKDDMKECKKGGIRGNLDCGSGLPSLFLFSIIPMYSLLQKSEFIIFSLHNLSRRKSQTSFQSF
jgi:hypothetical protein